MRPPIAEAIPSSTGWSGAEPGHSGTDRRGPSRVGQYRLVRSGVNRLGRVNPLTPATRPRSPPLGPRSAPATPGRWPVRLRMLGVTVRSQVGRRASAPASRPRRRARRGCRAASRRRCSHRCRARPGRRPGCPPGSSSAARTVTLVTSIADPAATAAAAPRRPRARSAAPVRPRPSDEPRAARSAARPTVIDASSWRTRSRICWISSRSAAARSNSSCLAAPFISASIRPTRASTLARSASLNSPRPLRGVDDGRLGDRAQPLVDVADALDDRRRLDPALEVVGLLDRPAAVGLVDRDPHRFGHPVGVHDHFAAGVACRPPDHLDERPGRPQEALLVGIEDGDQRHLGRSIPSRSRLMPTRTSKTPRRRSRRIATRSSVSTSLWRYWTLTPSSLR